MCKLTKYDSINLRKDANFEIMISKNVYWVPINILGNTKYTNNEIIKLIYLNPERKRENIHTLYEAIQLFQNSHFIEEDDTINIEENGFDWEHHKPGYFSVLSNKGCCASNASWLTYLLEDKYENMGFLTYSRPTGSGHVLNYIFNDGWYYIIDLLPMEDKYISNIPIETGIKKDFITSKYFTASLVKCKELKDYIHFFRRIQLYRGFEHLFFYHTSSFVSPISTVRLNDKIVVICPDNKKVFSLNDNLEYKTMDFKFTKSPIKLPKW